MRFGNLGADKQSQAEPFATWPYRASKKRMKQSLKGLRLNRRSRVGDGKLEFTVHGSGQHLNRCFWSAVNKRIAKQIREQLSDALAVADKSFLEIYIRQNFLVGAYAAQLCNNLKQDGFKRFVTVARGDETAAQAPTREIKYVLDQLRHPRNASIDLLGNLGAFLRTPQQKLCAGGDRGQWVTKIMAENRDELLAELRFFLVSGELLLLSPHPVGNVDGGADHPLAPASLVEYPAALGGDPADHTVVLADGTVFHVIKGAALRVRGTSINGGDMITIVWMQPVVEIIHRHRSVRGNSEHGFHARRP